MVKVFRGITASKDLYLGRRLKPARAYMNKDGWNQKENTAGCSRQDSLCELWFLYLGKIGVGEARCNEDGAKKKAGAQQRDSKGERNVRREVRFCRRPSQTRTVAQGRQGCPLAMPVLPGSPTFPVWWFKRNCNLGA